MATVTQLSSGNISSGTTLNLTGVSVEPGDMLYLFTCSYSLNGFSSVTNLGDVVLGNLTAYKNTGPFPNTWTENLYGLQTHTVSSQTITLNFSSSAAGAAILFRIRPDFGNGLTHRQRAINFSSTASTTRSSPSINVQETSIVIGACGVADDTFFTDTGTTGGSWSSVFYAFNNVGIYDIACFGQTKIMNAPSSSISYGGTFPASEYATVFIAEVIESGLPRVGMLNL